MPLDSRVVPAFPEHLRPMRPRRGKSALPELEIAVIVRDLPASTPEEQAYRAMVSEAGDIALRRALRLLSPQAAEDVLQELLFRFWLHWRHWPPERRTAAVFVTAARQLALDVFRRECREQRLMPTPDELESGISGLQHPCDDTASGTADVEYRSEWDLVQRIGRGLPERKRQILVLMIDYQMQPGEIAELLDTSPVTVRQQVREIRAFMRDGLQAPSTPALRVAERPLIGYTTEARSND